MNPDQLPLQDIHLPDSVHWWPPAIGWWLLGIVIIAMVFFAVRGLKHYRKKWVYRNAALTLLKEQYQRYKDPQCHEADIATAMLTILKRTAITAYPKQDVASLHGRAWVDFLHQQTSSSPFTTEQKDFIIQQQYQPNGKFDINALYKSCQQWIKQHKPPRGYHD